MGQENADNDLRKPAGPVPGLSLAPHHRLLLLSSLRLLSADYFPFFLTALILVAFLDGLVLFIFRPSLTSELDTLSDLRGGPHSFPPQPLPG